METIEQLFYSVPAVERFKRQEKAIRAHNLSTIPFGRFGVVHPHMAFEQSAGKDAAMRSPLFAAWLDHISRTAFAEGLSGTERAYKLRSLVEFIGNYAITATLMAEEEKHIAIRAEGGQVIVPEYGRVILPNAGERAWVDANVTADGITFSSVSDTVHIPRGALGEATDQWEPLRFIGQNDFRIPLNDFDPHRDIFRFAPAGRLSDEDHARWSVVFDEAWDYLQDANPEAAEIVRASMTAIVPLPEESYAFGKSAAAGAAFGVIGTNQIQDPQRLATHIAFGTIKHLFIALRNERPGIHAEDSELASMRVYPPSREGVGTAVYLQDDLMLDTGLARFFAMVATSDDPAIRAYGEISLARHFTGARLNLMSLRASGYANETDQNVVATLENELDQLELQVAELPDIMHTDVAASLQDHRISWRLHSAVPDAATIDYLRGLWERGEPCPWISVAVRASDDNASYTHVGRRTRYVLTEAHYKEPHIFEAIMQGSPVPEPFGEPTPGDIAFVKGDMVAARQHFAAAIMQNPSNKEAWAGFALTFHKEQPEDMAALLACPEVVAAAYAAVNDGTVAPDAFAKWLAPVRAEADFMGAAA